MIRERIMLPALVILAVGSLLLGAYVVSETSSSLIGARRTALEISTLNGIPSRLPVPFLQRHILVLFTPACPHCRTTLAHYSRLFRLSPSVLCFGISLGSASETDSLIHSVSVPFPVFLDRNRSVRTFFRVRTVPVVVFIDEEDMIGLTLAGSRSFLEDSLLFARFCRSGAPGAPEAGGLEGTDIRSLPEAPTAGHPAFRAPSACLAGGMMICDGPVGPWSAYSSLIHPGGPPQAAGPFYHHSFHKKEAVSCVPRLQG